LNISAFDDQGVDARVKPGHDGVSQEKRRAKRGD